MTLPDKKTTEFLEVLNDLVMIHEDRITCYRQALASLRTIDKNLQVEFNKIISTGEYYKQQLLEKIRKLNISDRTESVNCGKIYSAWRELKVAFSGKTQKAIIDYSLYNDQLFLSLYETALNKSLEMEEETRQLIEKQESELRKINDEIKEHNKPCYNSESEYAIQHSLL